MAGCVMEGSSTEGKMAVDWVVAGWVVAGWVVASWVADVTAQWREKFPPTLTRREEGSGISSSRSEMIIRNGYMDKITLNWKRL